MTARRAHLVPRQGSETSWPARVAGPKGAGHLAGSQASPPPGAPQIEPVESTLLPPPHSPGLSYVFWTVFIIYHRSIEFGGSV